MSKREKILELLEEREMTGAELAQNIGASREYFRQLKEALIGDGLIEQVGRKEGHGRGGTKTYQLTENARISSVWVAEED